MHKKGKKSRKNTSKMAKNQRLQDLALGYYVQNASQFVLMEGSKKKKKWRENKFKMAFLILKAFICWLERRIDLG